MADNEQIGGVSVGITGDLSDLKAAFSEAQTEAQSSGESVASAFNSAAAGADTFTSAAQGAGAASVETGNDVNGLAQSMVALGEALVIAEGLKEFGSAALEASDNVTRADIALTTLTHDGEGAKATIEGLDQLGVSAGLSMPSLLTAATRMTDMLPVGTDVVALLGHIADGAAVMGTDITTAATKFDMMATSGMASARIMTALGISLQGLAAAMNETGVSSDATAASAAKMFKALDESDRITVLTAALETMGGTAEKVREQTFGGSWASLVAQWDQLMVQAGNDMKPVVLGLLSIVATDIMPFLKGIAAGFESLPAPIQETVVGLGLALAAATTLGLAVKGLGLALVPISGLLDTLGISASAAAVEETTAATAATALGTAEKGAAVATSAATASIGAAIASRVVIYGGLAIALLSLKGAYEGEQAAEAGVTAQNAEFTKSLAALQVVMVRQGIDFSQLKSDYQSGQITITQFLVGLRDLETAYIKLHPPVLQAVNDAAAHTDKLSLLRDAVDKAQTTVDGLAASYTGAAGQSATLLAAENTLEAAQKAVTAELQKGQDALGNTKTAMEAVAKAGDAFGVILQKIPANYNDYIHSLQNGGETHKQLQSDIDAEIKKLTALASQMSGDSKAQIVGLIGSLNDLKGTLEANTKPAADLGVTYITTAGQMIQAQLAAQKFGVETVGLNKNVVLMAGALEDAQNHLIEVNAQVIGGTKNQKDLAAATKEVTTAQNDFNKAVEQAAGGVGGATDKISLLRDVLEQAQQKEIDVTAAFQSGTFGVGAAAVLSAQDAVTAAQNALNVALDNTPAASAAAAKGMDTVGTAAAAATVQVDALISAFDAFAAKSGQITANATPTSGSGDPFDISSLSTSTHAGPDDPQITGQYVNGVFHPLFGQGWSGGYFVGSKSLGIYGPDNPAPTASSSTGAAASGSASSSGTVPAPTSAAGATVGIGGTLLVDDDPSGNLYGQLDELITLLGGSFAGGTAGISAAVNGMTAAASSDAAASAAAAAVTATAATGASTAILATGSTIQNVATAIQTLATAVTVLASASLKNVLGIPTTIGGLPTTVGSAAGTGGGTNVLGGGTTTTIGGTGAAGIYPGEFGYGTQAVQFNFSGANFAGSGVTKESVMSAVTQALYTAGARFPQR